MVTSRNAKPRKRLLPHPNSVLDTPNFIEALERAGLYGIKIQPVHILAFYQALHRQHYPDLPTFVQNYYDNEQNAIQNKNGGVTATQPTPSSEAPPLKNPVSNLKNRNRMQLPRALLDFLQQTPDWCTLTTTVVRASTSADGSTTKLVIQLSSDANLAVESVLMRYTRLEKLVEKSTTGYGSGRAALCVSSQCGCAMGCTFCATGTMGFSGNLTVGEILEQVVHADRLLAEEWKTHRLAGDSRSGKLDLVRNIVFMGMGEPLDNYDNVVAACRALTDNRRWNIAHSRVTVSTVGIVDKIRKLTEELPEVNLAVSLHAPNQELRTAIVPSAKRYPIEDLVDALDNHMMTFLSKRKRMVENPQNGELVDFTPEERIKESTRRRAMIEYVMLEGPTSTVEAAHELGKLCEGRQLVVNLIPYNQTNVKDQLRCPSEEHMQLFRNIVSSYGSFCTIRRTMGADIDSACGQLVNLEQTRRRSTDMEDAVMPPSDVKPTAPRRPPLPKSDPQLESRLLKSLVVATSLSATCFVACSILYLSRRRR